MRSDIRGLVARLDKLEGNTDEAAMARACAEADVEYRGILATMGVEVLPGESAWLLLMALLLGEGEPCPSDQHPYRLPERLRDYWQQRRADDETN